MELFCILWQKYYYMRKAEQALRAGRIRSHMTWGFLYHTTEVPGLNMEALIG